MLETRDGSLDWTLEIDMASLTLQAEKRETRGKNEARRLRASGRIPAVVYGAEKGKATEIAVDPKVLLRILHSDAGVNSLIGLEGIGSGDTRVLVKEYQLDPISHKLLHVDFFQVAMDKMLTVTVPIVLKGDARGRALEAYARARETAAIAPRLSLDPAATVFQLGTILASVALPR